MPGLDALGWLQFERLCELVLEADAGVDPTRWEGSADPSRQLVCEDEIQAQRPRARAAGAGPLPVAARRRPPSPRRRRVRVGRDVRQPRRADGDVVYGEQELFDAIRRLPTLRLKLPSRALARRRAARRRRTRALDARHRGHARARARCSSRRRPGSARSRSCKAHHFLVLTGPPEMGKTAIARMLGLALLTEGWEVHECTRPEQVEAALRSLPPAAVHRRRRVRLDRVPRGRRRALGGEPRPHPEGHRRAPLARLDVAPGAAARRPAAAAPRARRRALPAAGGRPGRRLRARRRGEDPDPVPPRARGAPARRHARGAAPARRLDRRAPALHARADPPLRRPRRARSDGDRARAERADRGDGGVLPRRSSREHRELLLAMLDSPPGPGRRARPRRGAAPAHDERPARRRPPTSSTGSPTTSCG